MSPTDASALRHRGHQVVGLASLVVRWGDNMKQARPPCAPAYYQAVAAGEPQANSCPPGTGSPVGGLASGSGWRRSSGSTTWPGLWCIRPESGSSLLSFGDAGCGMRLLFSRLRCLEGCFWDYRLDVRFGGLGIVGYMKLVPRETILG